MTRHISFILLLSITSTGIAQQQITLQQCHQAAIDNFTLSEQTQLLQEISNLTLKEISANQLPKISINAQVTNQSDVTGLPIDIPGQSIPEIPKTQYKATLDIQQSLYNGGLNKYQKNVEQASSLIEQKKIEISAYSIKERVNKLYFGILLLDENVALVSLLKKELDEKIKVVASGVRNGIADENQLNELKAESLKVEQKKIEIGSNRRALFIVLNLITAQSLSNDIKLVKPVINAPTSDLVNSRPELQLFTYQKNVLEANKSLSSVALKPKAFAFATGGIGRPGLNFLDDQMQGFYIVGLKVKWDLWDWNKSNYTKQQLSVRQNIIKFQQETFDINVNAAIAQKQVEINMLSQLITKDNELIALRTVIKEIASKQLNGGIITTTDYIAKLNAENIAILNNKIRLMEMELAKLDYLMILGKEVN